MNEGGCLVDQWAQTHPEHVALRWVNDEGQDRRITFRQLAQRTDQVANALLNLGQRRGDQVLVDLPNLVAWWETVVGLAKAGMIAIPGTVLLTEKDIAFRVKAAEIDGRCLGG